MKSHDDADMLFLKSLHGSFQKLSDLKKEETNAITFI